MSKSSLTQIIVPADEGNYTKGRSGRSIEAITIHHMAGRLTAKQCGRIFQAKGRYGSSHYGVGYDGSIANYVDEEDTAWTNSNWDSNCKSVTIETSDNDNSWYVNDITLNALIKLVADIAKRRNLGKLVPGKNLTWHSMFTNTTCPGDYLRSKMQYSADEANKINGYGTNTDTTGVITYQAYTHRWYSEVNKCDDTEMGYAGFNNEYITAFRCKPQYGTITYQAKISGGEWLPPVSSKSYSDGTGNSYAGIFNKPIDLVKIKSSCGWVKYQVKTKEDGWLPMVDSRTETGSESYAGIKNHKIIGIRMY